MHAREAESLLGWAETLRPKFRGAEAADAREQLERRYAELSDALAWFRAQGRPDEARRLTCAMVPFWMATRRMDDGLDQLQQVLAMDGGDDAPRSRALFDAGYLAFWTGAYERSGSFQREAVALGRRSKQATVTALALVGLARIALRTDVERARRLCREAIAETEGTDDRVGRSSAMHVLGVAAQMAGDLAEARDVMRRRIALGRETGDLSTVSSEAGNLCMVERRLGNLDQAEALGKEALEIDARSGNEVAIPWKVNGLAAVAADRGELERAAMLIGIADATLEAAAGAWPPDELAQYEQTLRILDELDATERDRARAAGRSMPLSEAIAFALRARPVR